MSIEASNNKSGSFDRNLEFRGVCEAKGFSIAEVLSWLKKSVVSGKITLTDLVIKRKT